MGKARRVLIRTKQSGIAGISSLANGKPIKQAKFGNEDLDRRLGGKTSYQQWRFIYIAAIDENPLATTNIDNSSAEAEQENIQEDTSENTEDGEREQEEENGEEFIEPEPTESKK